MREAQETAAVSVPAAAVETTAGSHFIANYPPFSCWTPEALPALRRALSRPGAPAPLGVYVHLPFCRQRCTYCYFRVHPRRGSADVDEYIQAVLDELSLHLRHPVYAGRLPDSVYFGGGSPSYLSEEQINRLLGGLKERLSWSAVEEATFECEPGTVSVAKFLALRRLGITRLSLGFQTLNDAVLRQSGRMVTVAQCESAFHQAREAGFEQINVDLLAGLPGETGLSWRRGVERTLALRPECITIYQLELAYGSALNRSIGGGREVSLVPWPRKRQWVDRAFAWCEAAGYTLASGYMAVRDPARWRFVYTVDHFWQGADLIGLGETSFGYIQGVHYQNADTLDAYLAAVAKGVLPVRRAYATSAEERLRREVLLLLKTGSLDGRRFREKFGIELREHFGSEFEALATRGYLTCEGDSVRLTREGLLRVDSFLPMFYLPEHRGVRYS